MTLYQSIILLVTIFVLIVWWFFAREKIGHQIPNPLLKKYAYYPLSIQCLWVLRGLIFLLIGAIWMDIEIPIESRVKESTGNNIMLVLDISNSMKTDDIKPSRLEKAKEVIDSFLARDRIDRVGFTIFAGKTFVMSPLSQDRDGLRSIVSETTTDTIDQTRPDSSGTNIGDALIAGIEVLKKSISGNRIILLITDGRANTGIQPLLAAQEAKKQNAIIHTLAIGSLTGSVLSYLEGGQRKYFYDTQGEKVLADIDEVTLQEISRITSGRYFHADSPRLLENIFDEIDALVSVPAEYRMSQKNISISPYITLVIGLLMFVHILLSHRIRQNSK